LALNPLSVRGVAFRAPGLVLVHYLGNNAERLGDAEAAADVEAIGVGRSKVHR
jgi:hypothetical protein